jgi:hypothetical protein
MNGDSCSLQKVGRETSKTGYFALSLSDAPLKNSRAQLVSEHAVQKRIYIASRPSSSTSYVFCTPLTTAFTAFIS